MAQQETTTVVQKRGLGQVQLLMISIAYQNVFFNTTTQHNTKHNTTQHKSHCHPWYHLEWPAAKKDSRTLVFFISHVEEGILAGVVIQDCEELLHNLRIGSAVILGALSYGGPLVFSGNARPAEGSPEIWLKGEVANDSLSTHLSVIKSCVQIFPVTHPRGPAADMVLMKPGDANEDFCILNTLFALRQQTVLFQREGVLQYSCGPPSHSPYRLPLPALTNRTHLLANSA